jgi:hypothetical protein
MSSPAWRRSLADTDHWRHFFLILGIVWGAAAAFAKFVRHPHASAAAHH